MKELILKLKSLLATLTLDDAKKKEIETQIAELERQADSKTTPAKAEPARQVEVGKVELPAEIVTALGEIKTLRDLVEKQEQRAIAAEKSVKDKAEVDAKKRLADYEKKIVETEKKVSPAEWKEKWLPLLEANFEVASKIVDALPIHPASKQVAKPEDAKRDKPVGVMRSAPKGILDKVLEFSQGSEN